MGEHFRRRSVELRQCDVAKILNILPTCRRSVESARREIPEFRKEGSRCLQLRLRIWKITDVVTNPALLFPAEIHKGLFESLLRFAVEPCQSFKELSLVRLLFRIRRTDPFVNQI